MSAEDGGVQVALLGGFELRCRGRGIALPLGTQRLLAYLAMNGGSHRSCAAERLWPDNEPDRAAANLRTALWRGRRIELVYVIECSGSRLGLSRATRVDVTDLRFRTQQFSDRAEVGDVNSVITALGRELLPGWLEDWLIIERERWDQERLHTLEGLALQLLSMKQFLPALHAALTAIAIEPFRETAHFAVMRIHAAEGNRASALRHYERYRDLLDRELGVPPSNCMSQLALYVATGRVPPEQVTAT